MKSRKHQIGFHVILLIFILGVSNSVIAQEEIDYKNNSIYGSVGTVIFINQASISYERTLVKDDLLRLRLKANYGKTLNHGLDLDTDAKEILNHKSISAVLLFGLFEANLGLAFTQYELESAGNPTPGVDYSKRYNGKSIYGCTGIRYENESILLRVGFSNLEFLYVGVGFNF